MTTSNNSTEDDIPDDGVRIIEPDNALKKKIGGLDTKQLFAEEVVTKAQKSVDKKTDEFLEWVKSDLATLESSHRSLTTDLVSGKPFLEKLRRAAFTIKSQAGTFGYDLASQIARSLYLFCDSFKFTREQAIVLGKHIDVLQLIIRDNIKGDGGAIGQELLKEMERLCVRFRQ